MGHDPGASDVWSGCIGQRYPTSSRSSASTSSRLVGREAHEATPKASETISSERSHTGDVIVHHDTADSRRSPDTGGEKAELSGENERGGRLTRQGRWAASQLVRTVIAPWSLAGLRVTTRKRWPSLVRTMGPVALGTENNG